MATSAIPERLVGPDLERSVEEYNFEHFRTKHLIQDGWNTLRTRGILPGEVAPDFVLPRVDGGTFRLHDRRERPVYLRFGSRT